MRAFVNCLLLGLVLGGKSDENFGEPNCPYVPCSSYSRRLSWSVWRHLHQRVWRHFDRLLDSLSLSKWVSKRLHRMFGCVLSMPRRWFKWAVPGMSSEFFFCFFFLVNLCFSSRLTMIICTKRVCLLVQPATSRAMATVSANTRATWSFARVNQAVQTVVLAMFTNVPRQQLRQAPRQLKQLPPTPQQKPRYRPQKC